MQIDFAQPPAVTRQEQLLLTLKEKHPYTYNHCLAVEKYSMELTSCLRINWTSDQLDNLRYGARGHDIGKLGIALDILDFPGRLSEEQFAQIKTHPQKGVDFLTQPDWVLPRITYEAILYHHAAYAKGSMGYPQVLCGEDIPLAGRIVAVADIFDALVTERSYKPALPIKEAIRILLQEAGKKLDPYIVDIFVKDVMKMAA